MLFLRLVCVAAVFFGAVNAADLPLDIETTEGTVLGSEFNGARVWFNVPYAAPPVGSLRFRAPQAPIAYPGGTHDATLFAPVSCKQLGNEESSEDCLYLVIAAPSQADPVNYPNGFPVMFWIHGGALISGSKNEGGEGLTYADKNVIYVGINYRLNLYGFLKVEEYVPGNWGFLDQNLTSPLLAEILIVSP
eukprot:gene31231-37742_t